MFWFMFCIVFGNKSYNCVDCKIDINNIDCILLGYMKMSLKSFMELVINEVILFWWWVWEFIMKGKKNCLNFGNEENEYILVKYV